MTRLIIFITALTLAVGSSGQDFFRTKFDKKKRYIILTNPTVGNIKTIENLVGHNIFGINARKIRFVGVYLSGQGYDFTKSIDYVKEKGLGNYSFQEVRGNLNATNVFTENECTPLIKIIFNSSAGLFFFGGPDIPPAVYGEKNTMSVVTDPERHYFELTLLFHLLGGSQNEKFAPLLDKKPDYLVTGFCLGMQTMNVATGGTLIQDIPAEIYHKTDARSTLETGRANLHRNYWQELNDDTLLMGINLHTIHFTKDQFFGKIIKVKKSFEPRIYSNHHQSIEKLGKGFEVTAVSPDGQVIEGIAHKKYPNVFAVQFHPEVPGLYEDLFVRKFNPDDTPMSYNDIIGNQSVAFHKKYWQHIADIVNHK